MEDVFPSLVRYLYVLESQMSAFAAGVVLALTMWSNLQSGWKSDKEKEDIEKCIRVLKATERR